MINLQKDENGIYYLHNYIPVRSFECHSPEEIEITRNIWDYKNGESKTIEVFSNELMQAICEITQNRGGKKIGLIAAPPSKVEKISAVRESISMICNWYKNGIPSAIYGYNKEILDYSALLNRACDVDTSHEGKRATYADHMHSIICKEDYLSRLWTTFIIIDDVTTTGTIMDACRDILIEHGAKEKYIYRLAIAKTMG